MSHASTDFKKPVCESVSLTELVERNNKARGLKPMPLESELLLKRVRQGGASGQFLGAAFISAYDMSNFNLSLGEICNLDPEGFRLFHEILHIRFIPGWTDEHYNRVANQVEKLLELPF